MQHSSDFWIVTQWLMSIDFTSKRKKRGSREPMNQVNNIEMDDALVKRKENRVILWME